MALRSTWYNGLAYHTVKKLDKAGSYRRQADSIQIRPLWYHLVYHSMHWSWGSNQAYRRTVHLIPDNFDAWLNLACYQIGDRSDAMIVSELNPIIRCLGYLAVSCYETGDYKNPWFSNKGTELKPDET